MRGMLHQGQLLEKVNLEPDLQSGRRHGWSPRQVEDKGAGKRICPAKCMKLLV